jgi:hypothetical protein
MATVCMYTATGEAHGLINTLTNSCENNDFKHCTGPIKAILEKEKKEDARIVEVELIHKQGKHERLDKPYCRYAGDPILVYHLIPGYKYALPYGFVKEVNNVRMPIRSGLLEVDGEKVTKDGSPLIKDDLEGNWTYKLISTKY